MRRVAGGLSGLVLVFLIVALSGVGDADVGVAQGSPAAATATRVAEEAELANLRTQVAALSTEAARPGREDIPQGRLGGSRAEFDIAYGPPSIYIGPDEVAYQIDQVGQVTVGFVDDRAQRLVIVPPRPPAKPAIEPDPADWALAEAREIARRFAPTDATFGEDDPAAENGVVVPGTSEELAAVLAPADGTDCPPADGHRAFVVTFTAPTEDTVSAITLEVTPGGAPHRLATVTPANAGRASRTGGAVANSSLGGTVTVNGIRVVALRTRADAEGSVPPAPNTSYLAVEVTIENLTDHALRYALPDFVLTDEAGRELAAVCGGAEPAITHGELAPGDSIEGWISFQVPAEFRPERFVYVVDSARIGFVLD